MNLTKPFNSGLGKLMRKAARPLGGVDSLNPCCWRGERLHHHGGGVCWLFVLMWMDSWRHELIICKIWYKNNLKMRLMALLFDPPTRAPYQPLLHVLFCYLNPPKNYILTLIMPFSFVWYVIPLLKTGALASTCDLFLRVDDEKTGKNQCMHVQWLLLSAILARWQRPVASSEALDLLH